MGDSKQESCKDLQKSIRSNCCSFLLLFTIHALVIFVGAFGFFYIEHCLPSQQASGNKDSTEQQINRNTTINCSTLLNEIHLQAKATNKTCFLGSNTTDTRTEGVKTCEVKREFVFVWLEYSMTVATTIGS